MDKDRKIVIDRWSVTMVVIVISIIVFLFLFTKGNRKYAFLPFFAPAILGTITAMSAGRIRRNEYEGEIYYKGEKDCGFRTGANYKAIDGIMIEGTSRPPIYKTANGTDLIIKKDGTIHPAGFGTRFINYLDGAGYQNEVPDDCWALKD